MHANHNEKPINFLDSNKSKQAVLLLRK